MKDTKIKLVTIIETPDSKALVERLYNGKFVQAQTYLEGQPRYVKEVVNALAAMFKNAGWADGLMGLIITAALNSLYTVED